MHTIRYAIVLANGAVDRRTALTLDEAAELLGDRDGYVWPIEVKLTPPPIKVSTLGPDDTLIVNLAGRGVEPEAIEALAHVLDANLPDRWLVLDGVDAISPASASVAPPGAPDRLPWSHYAPELVTRLKGLVSRFPARTVADAAVTLADLIDEHGPEAVEQRHDGPAMTRPTITELVELHGTDKGYFHRYGEVYDVLLDRHRNTALRILEVGVKAGASLNVWADAFPAAIVTGVDIELPAVDWPNNVNVVKGNAYTAATAAIVAEVAGLDAGEERAARPFDIIIDDGPHTLASMIAAAKLYAPLLAAGGTFIIEDVLDAAWPALIAEHLPPGYIDGAFVVERNIVPPLDGSDGTDPARASRLLVVDLRFAR